MNCQDNSRLKVPLPELCKTTDIGCVPITSGKPDCPPEADQLPLAYDPNSETLWIFSCESRQWTPLTKFSLAELEEVSLDNFKTICDLLKVPVFYNPGHGTIQGHMSLGDFAAELVKCANLTPTSDSKTVVAPGTNVDVQSTVDGDTTTYTVSATVPPSTDTITRLEAGNNVEITSRTEGSTTTYKINATSPEIVDQNDITVLEAGDNVTLTSVTLGNTTTYKVSSTGGGPQDSKTILEAGDNITLEPTTVGAVTTYKISATGGGSGDGNDITLLEAGANVGLVVEQSGNTKTYTVSSTGGGPQDSKTIVEAGDNVTVTSNTVGATTTYVINSTASGGGGGPNIEMKTLPRTSTVEDVEFTFNDTNTYTYNSTYPAYIARSRDKSLTVYTNGDESEINTNNLDILSSPWIKTFTLTNPLNTTVRGRVNVTVRPKSVAFGSRGSTFTLPMLVVCATENREEELPGDYDRINRIYNFDTKGKNWGSLGVYTKYWSSSSYFAQPLSGQQFFYREYFQVNIDSSKSIINNVNYDTHDHDGVLQISYDVEIPANQSKTVYVQYWLWAGIGYPATYTYQFMFETEIIPTQFFNLISNGSGTATGDGNDITVVEAGTGVSVTSNKVGDTTTYTVSATGGGGASPAIQFVDLPATTGTEDVVFSFTDTNTYSEIIQFPSIVVRSRDNYIEHIQGNGVEVDSTKISITSNPWRKELTLTNPLPVVARGDVELYVRLKNIVSADANRPMLSSPALIACVTEEANPTSAAGFDIANSDTFIINAGRNWASQGKFLNYWNSISNYIEDNDPVGSGVTVHQRVISPDDDNMLHAGLRVSIPANSSKTVYIQYWLWNRVAYPATITYQFMWETEVRPSQFIIAS